MGKLLEMKDKIETLIAQKNLDPFKVKGAITMKTGFVLGLVNATTPDDEMRIGKLRAAAKEILDVNL